MRVHMNYDYMCIIANICIFLIAYCPQFVGVLCMSVLCQMMSDNVHMQE